MVHLHSVGPFCQSAQTQMHISLLTELFSIVGHIQFFKGLTYIVFQLSGACIGILLVVCHSSSLKARVH